MTTDSTEDDVIATAFVTKEFTFIDPLSENECLALIEIAEHNNIPVSINGSYRIVLFACDNLNEATSILAEINLIESIGKIREITEWDIVGLAEPYPFDIIFTPESDNDG